MKRVFFFVFKRLGFFSLRNSLFTLEVTRVLTPDIIMISHFDLSFRKMFHSESLFSAAETSWTKQTFRLNFTKFILNLKKLQQV